VLSRQEQRVWDDVQRFWAEEVDEPPRAAPPAPSRRRRPSRDPADLPAAVVAGVWITILLTLVGALVAALAIGVATALGWALWRVWPQLGRQGAPDTSWNGRKDRTTRGPADKPWHRRPRRLRDSR
jgi:hypothetical protein